MGSHLVVNYCIRIHFLAVCELLVFHNISYSLSFCGFVSLGARLKAWLDLAAAAALFFLSVW